MSANCCGDRSRANYRETEIDESERGYSSTILAKHETDQIPVESEQDDLEEVLRRTQHVRYYGTTAMAKVATDLVEEQQSS